MPHLNIAQIVGLIAAMLVPFAVIALIVLRRRPMQDGAPWPFYARQLLSPPEQVLYHRLVKALPECMVLAQVQASRVLGVRKGHNSQEWRNRIDRLSYDFVICARDSTVLAVIELDDSSHQTPQRIEADARKARASSAANVRLIRWNASALPDPSLIQAEITRYRPFDAAPR